MSVLLAAYNKPIQVELDSKIPLAFQPRKYPLSPQQKAVTEWVCTGAGNAVVIAGPGAGKTSLLLGVVPFIAEYPTEVEASTLHSYGFRAWKQANPTSKIAIDGDKLRKLIDKLFEETKDEAYATSWIFLRKLVSHAKSAGFGIPGAPAMGDVDSWMDLVDNYSLDVELKASEKPEPLIDKALTIYLRSIQQCKTVVDFDDMLLAPLYHRVKFPTFDWVLGDEAQDYSFIRRTLLLNAIRPATGRAIFVGDPRQALYSFSGADSKSIALIKEATAAAEFPLTVTYRLPKSVVRLAQCIMPELTATKTAEEGLIRGFGRFGHLPPVYLEPVSTAQTGFWSMGPFDADSAIICRNNKPLVELAYAFLRRKIPAYIEGRDIGEGLVKLAQRWRVKSLDALVTRLEAWRAKEVARFLKKKMESKADDINDKIDTLMVLIDATKEDGGHGISDLVDLIHSLFGKTPDGEKPHCTVLSSVHKFKGREAKRVFILGYSTYMPSKYSRRDDAKEWEIEGERCCIFVAQTRSLHELVEIVVPEKQKKERE